MSPDPVSDEIEFISKSPLHNQRKKHIVILFRNIYKLWKNIILKS